MNLPCAWVVGQFEFIYRSDGFSANSASFFASSAPEKTSTIFNAEGTEGFAEVAEKTSIQTDPLPIRAEPDTQHCIKLSANGNAVIQDIRRERDIQGRSFRGVKVERSKVSRALPWIALAEEDRLHLVCGPWNRDCIDEACAFPSGSHDNQIDAVSIAVRLSRPKGSRFTAFD